MPKTKAAPTPQITVSGVTFSADQVKSAVIVIDGRDIFIGEKAVHTAKMGFPTAQVSNHENATQACMVSKKGS